MGIDELNMKLEEAYEKLHVIDELRKNGKFGFYYNMDYDEDVDTYEINDKRYDDEDLDEIFTEAINAIRKVDRVKVDEFALVLPNLRKICNLINSCGKNKISDINSKFSVLKAAPYQEGVSVMDFRISANHRRDLFQALSEIQIMPSDQLTQEENVKAIKVVDEKLYAMQLKALESLIGEGKAGKCQFFNGKNDEALYELIKYEFSKGMVSDQVNRILSDTDNFVANLPKTHVKALIGMKTAPKAYRKMLKAALAEKKRLEFRARVDKAYSSVKSKPVFAIALPIVLAAILTGLHHGGAYLVRNSQEEKDMAQIERNIEEVGEFADYNCSAVYASEKDGKYYVEVYGAAVKEKGEAPKFCNMTYEVDKDLYETIFKFYQVDFEYNDDGKMVDATNTIKEDTEKFSVFGKMAANRARWETASELVETTKGSPVSVEYDLNNSERE